MKNLLIKSAKLLTLLVVFNIILVQSVFAIGASPMRSVLTAKPGDTVESTINVINSSKEETRVTLKKSDFIMTEDEDLKFIYEAGRMGPEEDAAENPQSLQNWIELPTELPVLQPGEEAKITYKINVPQDAQSHAYYGVVYVSGSVPNAPEGGSIGIGVSAEVAHLVLLEVDDGTGSLKTDLEFTNFTVDKPESTQKSAETGIKELHFITKFFNHGNTHQAPKGTITITDENKNPVTQLEVNKGAYNSLPEIPKTVLTLWESKTPIKPALYYAYYLGYDKNNKEMAAQIKFRVNDDNTVETLETNMGEKLPVANEQIQASKEQKTGGLPDWTNNIIIAVVIVIGLSVLIVHASKNYRLEFNNKKIKTKKKTKTNTTKHKKTHRKLLIIPIIWALTSLSTQNVFAQEAITIHLETGIDQYSVINPCASIDLGTFDSDTGKNNSSSPCNVQAYSNNVNGFTLSLHGTNNGLYNSGTAYEWSKLGATSDEMNTACSSSCSNGWGWRITNGTASEYTTVETDTDNNARAFDAVGATPALQYWHTVNYETSGGGSPYGDEVFITQDTAISTSANFDLEIGMVNDFQPAGVYSDTITMTLTETP